MYLLMVLTFVSVTGWLSNGTLVSVGGNVNELPGETPNAQSGLTSVRMFTPGADASNVSTMVARRHGRG